MPKGRGEGPPGDLKKEGTMSATEMNRRQFVSLAGIGAGTLAAMGLAGCSPAKPSLAGTGGSQPAEGSERASSWLGEAPEIAEDQIVRTEATDLLIIGAGNAGMSAAATAADLGMDFMVCDKAGDVQASRHWVGAVNSRWQKEAGINTDTNKLLNELTRYASGKCSQEVRKVWINESGETIEYLNDILAAAGMEIYLDVDDYDHPTGGTDYYVPIQQHMWYSPAVAEAVPPALWGDASAQAGMARNKILADYIASKGTEVSFGYKLAKLMREESGRVTGAIFETNDGYVQVDAAKGVLLATGGYAANPVMLSALAPAVLDSCTAADKTPNCTGDGIRAGLWAGARMDRESAPMIFDRGAVSPGVDCGLEGEGMDADFPGVCPENVLGSLPFLKVNRRGERFFNESAPYDWCAAAAANQPGGVWCSVFDANASADAARFQVVGCAKIGAQVLQGFPPEEAVAVFPGGRQLLEQGALKKADTLEELANQLGLPQDAFLATVERYNELYDKQVDEDYGKEAFRLSEIRTAPFYGCWFGGSLLTTLDGLKINANMQVLDQALEPIPGLYAAGDCSGSVFSGNYPEYLVGCAIGRTLTEGRHAVRYISENE